MWSIKEKYSVEIVMFTAANYLFEQFSFLIKKNKKNRCRWNWSRRDENDLWSTHRESDDWITFNKSENLIFFFFFSMIQNQMIALDCTSFERNSNFLFEMIDRNLSLTKLAFCMYCFLFLIQILLNYPISTKDGIEFKDGISEICEGLMSKSSIISRLDICMDCFLFQKEQFCFKTKKKSKVGSNIGNNGAIGIAQLLQFNKKLKEIYIRFSFCLFFYC